MSERRISQLLIVMFFVGIILHLVPQARFITLYITDVFLFGANLLVLATVYKQHRERKLVWLVLSAWVFTYLAEYLGVLTGKVFGSYYYGDTFKVQLLEVPLIIPFNWVILVLASLSLVRQIKIPAVFKPILASLAMVAFDYIMEPVAMYLDYWQWEGGRVPIQNYISWFIIALLISSATEMAGIRLKGHLLRYYLIIQFVFFLILNLSMKIL